MLGGKGKGADALTSDYVRLFRGSADFAETKNKFVLYLAEAKATASEDAAPLRATNPKGTDVQKTNKFKIKMRRDTPMTIGASLSRQPSLSVRKKDNTNLSKLSQVRNFHDINEQVQSPVEKLDVMETPTETSQFGVDFAKMCALLSTQTEGPWWHIFCVKPNDVWSPKKFSDERVRQQIRRSDLSLMIAKQVGKVTTQFTWAEFHSRYQQLVAMPDVVKKLKSAGNTDSPNAK